MGNFNQDMCGTRFENGNEAWRLTNCPVPPSDVSDMIRVGEEYAA